MAYPIQEGWKRKYFLMISALSFGEILWDIIEGEAHIGGAPFNLAAHLVKMGAQAYMISSVGTDVLGRRAEDFIAKLGIDPAYITVQKEHPTGSVDVFLDGHGHPDYAIHECTAWDNLDISEDALRSISARSWDVFCFGTLAQRSDKNRAYLGMLLDGIRARHIFYDMNLRQSYYRREWIEHSLSHATIVKLNDDEAIHIADMLCGESIEKKENLYPFIKALASDYEIDVIVLTLGKDGAIAYKNGVYSESTCGDVAVVDTVGAGDSFSAGFLFSLLSGADVGAAAKFAAKIADFVVSHRGAIPEYTHEQRRELEQITGASP